MLDTKVCTRCALTKPKDAFRVCNSKKGAYSISWCKACERERALQKYHENNVQLKEQNRLYKQANREKINERRRVYTMEKMKDPVERFKRNMKALISTKIKKTKHTQQYLGTEVTVIVKWLEWNFQDGMTWDNHGQLWQIDHTLPIASFDLQNEADCVLCFNWRNLMPLTKRDNQSKSAKIIPSCITKQEQSLRLFYQENNMPLEDLDNYLQAYNDQLRKSMVRNTLKLRETPKAQATNSPEETHGEEPG